MSKMEILVKPQRNSGAKEKNCRFEQAEERISEPEGKIIEMIKSGKGKNKD